MTCSRDMEIWVPKSGKSFSQGIIEEVWEAWRNDAPKDECKVPLEGPEKEWWTVTEMGLLRAYWFAGHVTESDGTVGTVSMGAGFVWLDRSKCGSEHIGREEEGSSSERADGYRGAVPSGGQARKWAFCELTGLPGMSLYQTAQ